MENPPLASLSLTHVHYNPDDRVSYLCAWLALVPQGLCITYATLIWSTREAEILLMFAGQMACEALNWGLKRWIKEERPRQMYGKGYGMPSSHAQFVSFFSVSLALFLLLRHRPHPHDRSMDGDARHTQHRTSSTLSQSATTLTQRVLLSALALGGAAAVAYSRIYLSYHTPKQVLVGCAAGAVFAVGWFAFTWYLRHAGWMDWGLDTPLARAVRMRDLVVSEDLLEAGWQQWEQRRKRRDLGKKVR